MTAQTAEVVSADHTLIGPRYATASLPDDDYAGWHWKCSCGTEASPWIQNWPESEWPAAIEEIGTPVLDLELPATVEEALAQVEGMKSVLNPAVMAEGIVWHNTAGARIPELQGRTGMKAINNRWLVKHS